MRRRRCIRRFSIWQRHLRLYSKASAIFGPLLPHQAQERRRQSHEAWLCSIADAFSRLYTVRGGSVIKYALRPS